jgi:hypothetical protein
MKSTRLLLFLLTLAVSLSGIAQDSRARGQQWDKQINSTLQHNWTTTKICVQFTSPSFQVFTGTGFWDSRTGGGDIFRVRAAFNELGNWSWTLVGNAAAGCAATSSLSPLGGTINVTADTTGLPLYATGPIRTSGHYLIYSGGAPISGFQWMGDTSWGGPHLSTLAAWQSYTLNRKNKNDTVIQVSVPLSGNGAPTDANGARPFTGTGCNTGILPRAACLPNKVFWDQWDQHINSINQNGMLAVVIGLYKRITETPTWPTVADSQGYARFIAGRLAGNYTALSPGFDELPGRNESMVCDADPNTPNQACRARAIGHAIKEAILLQTAIDAPAPRGGAPLTALVTHHIGGGCPDGFEGTDQCLSDLWSSRYQTEGWLDFQLIQSGQGLNCAAGWSQARCLNNRSSQRVLRIYNNPTIKPVVDGEAIYDQFDFQAKNVDCPNGIFGIANTNYSANRARQQAFNTLLSGGTGFTHGVAGTWDWSGNVTCRTVSDGTNAQSSTQMGKIRQLFSTLRWYRLVPDCQLWGQACSDIKNADQTTLLEDRRRMYSRDSNGAFAVAYFPDNLGVTPFDGSLKLDLNDLVAFTPAAPWKTEWYNPRRSTGNGGPCVCTATAISNGGTVYSFNRPYAADWGLVIRNTNNIGSLNVPNCATPDINGNVACP